jgi:hypothetical protein
MHKIVAYGIERPRTVSDKARHVTCHPADKFKNFLASVESRLALESGLIVLVYTGLGGVAMSTALRCAALIEQNYCEQQNVAIKLYPMLSDILRLLPILAVQNQPQQQKEINMNKVTSNANGKVVIEANQGVVFIGYPLSALPPALMRASSIRFMTQAEAGRNKTALPVGTKMLMITEKANKVTDGVFQQLCLLGNINFLVRDDLNSMINQLRHGVDVPQRDLAALTSLDEEYQPNAQNAQFRIVQGDEISCSFTRQWQLAARQNGSSPHVAAETTSSQPAERMQETGKVPADSPTHNKPETDNLPPLQVHGMDPKVGTVPYWLLRAFAPCGVNPSCNISTEQRQLLMDWVSQKTGSTVARGNFSSYLKQIRAGLNAPISVASERESTILSKAKAAKAPESNTSPKTSGPSEFLSTAQLAGILRVRFNCVYEATDDAAKFLLRWIQFEGHNTTTKQIKRQIGQTQKVHLKSRHPLEPVGLSWLSDEGRRLYLESDFSRLPNSPKLAESAEATNPATPESPTPATASPEQTHDQTTSPILPEVVTTVASTETQISPEVLAIAQLLQEQTGARQSELRAARNENTALKQMLTELAPLLSGAISQLQKISVAVNNMLA